MPQTRKPEVRARIVDAAARELAAAGYRGTTVASIARRAALSAGNVYRYFEGKEALFHAVVDDVFVERFDALLEARVAALLELDSLPALDAPAAERQEDLLAFWVANRHRVIIVLDRCEGTRLEGFGARFVDRLVQLTLQKLRRRRAELPEHVHFVLQSLFDGTRRTIVAILEHQRSEAEVRAAFATFWAYQLAGLAGLEEGVTR